MALQSIWPLVGMAPGRYGPLSVSMAHQDGRYGPSLVDIAKTVIARYISPVKLQIFIHSPIHQNYFIPSHRPRGHSMIIQSIGCDLVMIVCEHNRP